MNTALADTAWETMAPIEEWFERKGERPQAAIRQRTVHHPHLPVDAQRE
jgi:hypothetical protein